MDLGLPGDGRRAGADHLRPVLLDHHLRPHAPRGHRGAQGGAHVPHGARRQHRHVHHRRARRARRIGRQARAHAAGGLRPPFLQPDGHLHLVRHLAAALHPHQCRQVPGQHHGQVPLVRPRVPRRVLLLRPGHLHGLLARGRRAADRAHHAVRPRRPLRGRRQRDAEALPREAAAQAANVGVAARAAALAAPVRRARLPAAGPRLHLLQDRQVKNRRAQERQGRARAEQLRARHRRRADVTRPRPLQGLPAHQSGPSLVARLAIPVGLWARAAGAYFRTPRKRALLLEIQCCRRWCAVHSAATFA
mmetsp:Transcript_7816/g.19376  ORF Transcript_7816/g.19376 Transcript_7816/m.19376 type:complete len:305 (-) Transcript_7816:77-991(-)